MTGIGIVRLNPQDGLFLRAEHLQAIQDYAREIGAASGRSGGPGIAYGFTATLPPGASAVVQVTPGLAFDQTGRALFSSGSISKPLPPNPTPGCWVVELEAAEEPTGDLETIYGVLCDEPCGGTGSFRAYLTEGVAIGYRRTDLPRGSGFTASTFRSVAASQYFEDERRGGGSLLPTSRLDRPDDAALDSPWWRAGNPAPSGTVPVGLLLYDGAGWKLDVWAARRDRIEVPAARYWTRRTGRRPDDVFLAQVLQFQAQLTELTGLGGGRSLPELGVVELPPAGYLPVAPSSGESVDEQVLALLGPDVNVRFCTAPADEIGLVLEQAQHLDRIPLVGAVPRPALDVVVPDGSVTLRSVGSQARFLVGAVGSKGGVRPHGLQGLARFAYRPGGRVTLAFAGSADSKLAAADPEGLWASLELDRSPFELTPEDVAQNMRATVAVHQPQNKNSVADGTATQTVDLDCQLECLSATDSTFQGVLRGDVSLRNGQTRWGRTLFHQLLGLTLTQVPGTDDHRLDIDLAGDLTARIQVPVSVDAQGLWHVTTGHTAAMQSGPARAARQTDFDLTLDEIPAADVPNSTGRLAAERGLLALAATAYPSFAVTLLFDGADAGAEEAGFTGPQEWVAFTRRHLLSCDSRRLPGIPPIELDLYVWKDDRQNVRLAAARGWRYVGRIAWDGQSSLLSQGSATVLASWRGRHPDEVAEAATVWPGALTVATGPLVAQAVSVLSPGVSAPVTVTQGAFPAPTTPGSDGVLLVTTRQIPVN